MRLIARERTLVPPTATANESSCPSPWTIKLNDMETAFDGTASGIQAHAGAFVPPPVPLSSGELGDKPFGANRPPSGVVSKSMSSDERPEPALPDTRPLTCTIGLCPSVPSRSEEH